MSQLDFRHYIPILKGRQGEFTALDNARADTQTFTPLLEVIPGSVEYDDEPDPEMVKADIRRFADRLIAKWGERDAIVDAGLLPVPQGHNPTAELIKQVGYTGGRVRPVLRPSDSPEILRGIADVIGSYQVDGACIRLAGEDLDDTDEPLASTIDGLLDVLNLDPEKIDLVLDVGEVSTEQAASFGARIARLTLSELPYIEEWHLLAVGAGSFPTDLNSIQPGVLATIPRLEADLWRGVKKRVTDRVPSFADYAIAHPVMPAGVGFAPAPQLRYSGSTDWLVMKGRKGERRGPLQFFDICRTISVQSEFTKGLSWGDERIDVVNSGATDEELKANPGTGNAMVWRAIGTSHHIALVVSRLARFDEP